MPIYAYKCSSCGHTQDVLQKLSAAPLTECPVCGQATYSKQITAPQFQLKGSGWYVTDFRSGSSSGEKNDKTDTKGEPAKADAKVEAGAEPKSDSKANGAKETPAATPAAPATAAPATSAAPAKPAAANEK